MSDALLLSFSRLCEVRAFARDHLEFLRTVQDYDLVNEVGLRSANGAPLTVNQALRLNLGSVATVQRQIRRLRKMGVIAVERSPADGRVANITLTPKALKALTAYAALLGART